MQQGRPSTSPQPVITPSAGASLRSIARCEEWGPAWMPSSTNVPGSTSRSIRSRAVSLPRSCWSAIFSLPPPSFAFSRRACRSSTSPFMPVFSPCSVPEGASGASASAPTSLTFSASAAASLTFLASSPLVSSLLAISLSALPFRLALLEEGPCALEDVLGRERQGELGSQVLERVVESHVVLPVHGVVAEPHQHRALRRELLRPLPDRIIEFALRDDLVGEPVAHRVGRREPLAEKDHLVDLLAGDVAVDDRHDHVGEGADVDLRGPEVGALLRDHEVAGEGQSHAARHHVSVRCAQRGLAEPGHEPEELQE